MTEEQKFADLEKRLRALKPTHEDEEISTARLLAKGRRQLVARDAVSFGFAHLLQGMLALLSILYTARGSQTRRNEA